MIHPAVLCSFAAAFTICSAAVHAEAPVDGKFPPPKPPEGKWENLFAGTLESQWTGMSMSIQSPLISTKPNPDRAGDYILRIDRGPTGLIRTIKARENYILEYEWRHLTEAPSANGGNGTSGNSGIIIAHSALPKPGGPYPNEGHEIQVCNLGNGEWYTSHGDIFTMPGSISTGIPDPRFGMSFSCGHRSMPTVFRGSRTGEWNHIRLTCVDGVLQNEVNGYLVTAMYRVSPRKGYISIESEGAPVEFRHMRLQELKPDPDLAPKHVAPLLPEPMTTDYITTREPVTLPAGNFMVIADVQDPAALSAFITGAGFPDTQVSGRIQVQVREGKATVSAGGKEVVASQPVAAGAAAVLHLERGKFGHVLLFKPVPKAS
jgi:hypothetical protein